MTVLGRVILKVICLVVCCSGVQAKERVTAEEAFRLHYWNTAIELLKGQYDTPIATEMLAIAYYQTRDFELALPYLKKALAMDRDGMGMERKIELNSAMMEVQLAFQHYSLAYDHVEKLEELGQCKNKSVRKNRVCSVALFGKLRINLNIRTNSGECIPDSGYEQLCEHFTRSRTDAKGDLGILVRDENLVRALRLRAANTLIEALLFDGELGPAYQVAEFARGLHTDAEYAVRYDPFTPENQANSRFKYDLGYRFVYDDNVTFPDDDLATGQGDYRHTLMADLLYERPLRGDWSFYAAGNFLQSLHHDLKEFDRTHVAGSVALGHMGQRTGWRIPLELTYVWLDGDTFRNSIAVLPGFYIQFGNDFLSHFYARLQRDDYDWFADTEEDRSGDVAGGGVLLTGQLTRRLQVRSYFEFNRYDSDGVYWSRDEVIAFVHGEFELSARWQTALAFRYKREDYDNVRRFFADRQQDKSKEVYLNITHNFAEKWWWRGQVSLINHESNIGVFDYDRNIYSIAVTRDF